MRRLFGVLLLCSSLAFIAAAPSPSPSPAPAPSVKPTTAPTAAPAVRPASKGSKATPLPSPSATPFVSAAPSVVVYPFETPTDVNSKVGFGIAQIFSQVFVNSGNLTVLAIGQGVKRSDYQTNARAKHADYYIAGYVQPIGNEAAVVAQLVNVNSGTSAYSQTAQISSVQDVASQALTFDGIIQQMEHREQVNITDSGSPTPAPEATNGANVKINGLTNAVSSLFKGGKSKGGPSAQPTPKVVKPTRGVIVARINGNASGGDLTSATNYLVNSFNRAYNAKASPISPANVAKSTDALCGTQRDNTVSSGTLNVRREGGGLGAHNVYDFTLNVYTCFGAQLFTTNTSDRNIAKAIDDAVEAYAKDHPDNG